MLFINAATAACLFYKKILKDKNINYNPNYYDNNYGNYLKGKKIFRIIIILHTLFAFILSIPYIFYNIAFILIIILISIPFKFWIIKFFIIMLGELSHL